MLRKLKCQDLYWVFSYNENMTYGERLKELRIAKGVSQKEIANAIGVDVSSISYWERDIYEPKANYIAKMARFFAVSADFLLGLEDEIGNKI